MLEDLQRLGYAERTQTSYVRSVRQLGSYWHFPAEEIAELQVRDYFLYCKNDYGWIAATMRISYSGIKFFYTTTFPQNWNTLHLLKIKRPATMPTVLGIDEVRLSEALNLEVSDIDRERMTLRVRNGKAHMTTCSSMRNRSRKSIEPNSSKPSKKLVWRFHMASGKRTGSSMHRTLEIERMR